MTDFNNLNEEKLGEQTDPADAIVSRVDQVIEEAEAQASAQEQAVQNAEVRENIGGPAAQAEAPENAYRQPEPQAGAYENRPQGAQQPQYNPQYGGAPQPRYSSQYNGQQYQGQYRPPYNQQPQYNPYVPHPVPPGYVQKNRILAGIFGILFGGIGLHNFYLGFTTRAVIQIVVSIVTCGIGALWGFVEGIMIIAGYYNNNCDANGIPTKEM